MDSSASNRPLFLRPSQHGEALETLAPAPPTSRRTRAAASPPGPSGALLDRLPVPVMHFRPEGLVYANEAARAFAARTARPLHLRDVVHPSDAGRLAALVTRLHDAGSASGALRLLARDGGEFVVEAHLFHGLHDDDGVSVVLLDRTPQAEAETARDATRSVLTTFLEQSPVGLVHLDAEGVVTFESRRVRAVQAVCDEAPWTGRDLRRTAAGSAGLAPLADAVLDGDTVHDAHVHLPGARPRDLSVSGAPIRADDGVLLGAVLALQDVTEARVLAAEAALHDRVLRAEAHLRDLALGSADEARLLDAAARAVVDAFGTRTAGVFMPLLLAPDTFTLRAVFGADTEALERMAFVPGADPALVEAVDAHRPVLLHADVGAAQNVACFVVPFYDADRLAGLVVADAGSLDDVRVRRRLHTFVLSFSALWSGLQAFRRFRSTVEAIDAALFTYTVGPTGRRTFRFLTPQIERLTGLPAEALLEREGACEALLASPAERSRLGAHLDRLTLGHESEVTLRVHLPDGTLRYLRERATPSFADGQSLVVAGTLADVTDQVRAERVLVEARAEAEQRSQDKSAFIYTLSHELRTPLASLFGFADLLVQELPEDASPHAVEFATTVRDKARQTLALVNDLFELAALDTDQRTIPTRPTAVAPLLDAALQRTAHAARAGVATEISPSNPSPVALADANRVGAILDTLLANAYKFTHGGHVAVRTWAEDGRVAVQVADTGIGMAPAFLGRLFTPFVQEDQRLNRDYGGTGLGLALAHRLAHRMGGRLEAASVKGQGSVFTLWLDEADAEAL